MAEREERLLRISEDISGTGMKGQSAFGTRHSARRQPGHRTEPLTLTSARRRNMSLKQAGSCRGGMPTAECLFSQFIEHEPGPRGSPQLPQAPDEGEKLFCDSETAKVESCWSRFRLAHPGHSGASDPRTIASKRRSHSLQTYSKIGIGLFGDVVILRFGDSKSRNHPITKSQNPN